MKVQIPAKLMNEAIFIGKQNGKEFAFKGMPGEFPEDTVQVWGQADLIGFEFLPIYMQGYRGGIPAGCELVAKTPDGEMYTLMGFDEVGMFGEARYGFAPIIGNGDLSKFEFEKNPEVFKETLKAFTLPDGPIPVK